MKLVWTQHAENMRNLVIDYIAQDNIDAAIELDLLIEKSCENLQRFPMLGKKGRAKSVYELVVHSHYILAYQITNDIIEILAIAHTSRDFSRLIP